MFKQLELISALFIKETGEIKLQLRTYSRAMNKVLALGGREGLNPLLHSVLICSSISITVESFRLLAGYAAAPPPPIRSQGSANSRVLSGEVRGRGAPFT